MNVSLVIEIVAPLVISRPMPRKRVHRRQRHDERRQAHLHDAEGVEEADDDADRERDRHRAGDRGGEAEIVGQQPGDDHADEAATAPTDRSMPAVMMTKVSPIARIAIIAP